MWGESGLTSPDKGDKSRRFDPADQPDPAHLRSIFGENLRRLTRSHRSIAGLCRELGINRTQFNRYLSGESFPRPDILHRICTFVRVDARILLEPLEDIRPLATDVLDHPAISDFLGMQSVKGPEEIFPSGFYRFLRRSFINDDCFVTGLLFVFRDDGYVFIRGYEAKDAMRQQGIDTTLAQREFRGIVLQQEDGIAALIARRRSMTCTFNFLTRVNSFQNNFWEGYATRTTRESLSQHRATRMIYEYIGTGTANALRVARTTGFCDRGDLSPFHARLLRPDEDFR